ncbi:ADIPOR-like receptor [Lachnellula occidentalis]|uniref:ADIPOR-like receptor n=1 Tax=Lachnellula occidentalis TaxID=215460 RepID=A0A8H8UG15_9HELO|nr:ADIPOR-like receptor [Lachnellula occidentalis]
MSVRQRRPSTTEVVKDAVKKVGEKIGNALTVPWDDLPAWQRDNHYIYSGYRPASESFKKSFASLGYIHNESVNIYSHLLGAVVFSISGVIIYSAVKPRYQTATSSDVLAFSFFFAGAALCLGMSGTYHTISNHSPIVAKFGNKLDYVGIVCLITGSFIPAVFYGFYCHPQLQEVYWTMISSLGLGCASVSIFERFRTPPWRPYRAGMFVGMGLSAVIPVLHGVGIYGVKEMQDRMGMTWMGLEGFLYILGAGLYAARWPERSWPGTFDIWGSSHQIFHMLVLAAATSHLYGLMKAFDYHHTTLGLKC